jgi:hypothetical protein
VPPFAGAHDQDVGQSAALVHALLHFPAVFFPSKMHAFSAHAFFESHSVPTSVLTSAGFCLPSVCGAPLVPAGPAGGLVPVPVSVPVGAPQAAKSVNNSVFFMVVFLVLIQRARRVVEIAQGSEHAMWRDFV